MDPKTTKMIFYVLFAITVILVAVFSYLVYRVRNDHKKTLNTETIGCPTYTCPGNKSAAWRTIDGGKSSIEQKNLNAATDTSKL